MKKYQKQDFRDEIKAILAEINLPDGVVAKKLWELERFRTNRVNVLRYRRGANPQTEEIMQHYRSLRDKLRGEQWKGQNRRVGDRRQAPRMKITGTLESRVEQLRISDFLSDILKTQGETQEMLRQVLMELQKK